MTNRYLFDDFLRLGSEPLTYEQALSRIAEEGFSFSRRAQRGLAQMAKTGELPKILDKMGKDILLYRKVGKFDYVER